MPSNIRPDIGSIRFDNGEPVLRTQNNGVVEVIRVIGVQVYTRFEGKPLRYVMEVPEGYKTDGATIPFFARCFLPKNLANNAGVVHDYLYQTPGMRDNLLLKLNLEPAKIDRRWVADHIFYALLRQVDLANYMKYEPRLAALVYNPVGVVRHCIFHWIGVPLGYMAIRVFGGLFYKNQSGE